MLVFGVALVIGVIYAGCNCSDLAQVHSGSDRYVLLGIALLIALASICERFHDTANANRDLHALMEPHTAVVWWALELHRRSRSPAAQ
jgi:hypothetical protein